MEEEPGSEAPNAQSYSAAFDESMTVGSWFQHI